VLQDERWGFLRVCTCVLYTLCLCLLQALPAVRDFG
jgi:hypothetical protein